MKPFPGEIPEFQKRTKKIVFFLPILFFFLIASIYFYTPPFSLGTWVLLSENSVGAQESTEYVEVCGYVRSSEGNPIPMAQVLFISRGDTLSQLSGEYYYDDTGRYTFYLPRSPVSHVQNQADTGPQTFELFQNYPNPFNPATAIEYELKTPLQVKLIIYNVLGQEVRHLENALKQPGRYRVTWNGLDDNGHFSGSGIYFYRLEADKHVQTRKMLLLDGGISSVSGNTFSSGHKSALKPAAEDNASYEIIVTKEGYESYHEAQFTLPTDTNIIEKDVILKRLYKPGDYLPLKVGNTWEYVDALCALGDLMSGEGSDLLISESKTTVTGSQTINGKTYYVLDHWAPFLPSVFHDERVTPRVRFDDDGDFILLYGDAEVVLYEFSKDSSEIIYSDLYAYFLDVLPPDSTSNMEIYERLKNVFLWIWLRKVTMEITAFTPAGTYDRCWGIYIYEYNEIEKYSYDYIYYFNQSVGLVLLLNRKKPSCSFLKRAQIDSVNYGVPLDVLASDTITPADIGEIVRLALDRGRIKSLFSYSFMSRNPVVGTGIMVARDNIPDGTPLPSIPDIPFKFLPLEAILRKAENEGKFCYVGFEEVTIKDMTISIEVSTRITPIDCFQFGDCGGEGYIIEFKPKFGMWIGKFRGGWVID